jgi:hypothetical protein
MVGQPSTDWPRWGPYLSERQWGTVREDYSPDGGAWSYLPHDFLLLVNAWWEPLDVVVPATRDHQTWHPVIDMYEPTGLAAPTEIATGDRRTVRPRSIVVLRGCQPAR